MPRTDRKKSEKDIEKEGETNREKVWSEKEIGRMRTFLRSLVSEFQGSYIVVSQQQASSAAYNTHGVFMYNNCPAIILYHSEHFQQSI